MQGTPVIARFYWYLRRIIPADAGNTYRYQRKKQPSKDHPRGCGEHGAADMIRHIGSGSSPRMRGTQTEDYRFTPVIRIIPADAGNTIPVDNRPDFKGDHPRGCGEHLKAPSTLCLLPGSSQRMRGTLGDLKARRSPSRIIPADAGNTTYLDSPKAFDEDHPRGCGEHQETKGMLTPLRGSSPRMRGTQ